MDITSISLNLFSWRVRLTQAVLLLVCLLPFVPGLTGPFMLDDKENLRAARLPNIQWQDIYDTFFGSASGVLRRPISNLSLAATKAWIGTEPFHYKLVNLIIHGLIALALWALAIRVLKLLYPALESRHAQITGFLAAALWVIHPLQISTVLYAVQRMTQLSALFVVLALIAGLNFLQKAKTTERTYSGLFASAAVWALGVLALLSKENGALLPVFLLVLFLSSSPSSRMLFTASPGKRVFFAICSWGPIILGAVTFALLWDRLTNHTGRDFTFMEHVLTEPFVLAHYVRCIFLPDIRQMGLLLEDMPLRGPHDAMAWIMLTATLTLPFMALALRRYSPILCLAILWFLAAHLIESTVIPLEIAFEHRNYLAMFGPLLAVAYGLTRLSTMVRPAINFALPILIVLVLGGATFERAQQWSRQDLFVYGEVRNHPNAPRAQSLAAALDLERGDVQSSINRIQTVKALRPNSFWPVTHELHLACIVSGYPLDWERMRQLITARPNEVWTNELLRTVVLRFPDACPYISPTTFDQFLGVVADVFSRNQLGEEVERTLVLRSYMAKARKDNDAAKQYLVEASNANPRGSTALFDLAYLQLNTDDLDGAMQTIARLKQTPRATSQSYRIDELESYLENARTELSMTSSSKTSLQAKMPSPFEFSK